MATEFTRLLKRLDLTRIDMPGESLEKFRERTSGFIEARWDRMRSPEQIAKSIEFYGFDCYMQGLLDGAQTCVMRPQLVEDLRASNANPQGKEP